MKSYISASMYLVTSGVVPFPFLTIHECQWSHTFWLKDEACMHIKTWEEMQDFYQQRSQ